MMQLKCEVSIWSRKGKSNYISWNCLV